MNLRLQEVFRFLNSTPASRNFVEGEAVLNAGHIVLVGTTNVSDLQLDIFGVCLQTSSLKSNPHELKGRIQIDDGNSCKILAMECSCKAGLGETCKHISAVLLYCSRMDLSQLEQVSSTDVKCLWSQNKTTALKSYEPEPLASYACFESMEVTRVDEVNLMNMKNELMMSMPSCALAVHKFRKRKHTETVDCPGNDNEHPPITIGVMQAIGKVPNSAAMTNLSKVVVGPLRECCQNLYDQLKCDDYRSLCMDTLHSVEKWRKERQFRVTGSRCYEIFTYKKNDWMNKSSKYFWPSSFTNKYVQHGVKFEPVARRLYCRRYNVEVVECGLVISPQNPFLGFSPDGIVMKDGEPWKLLEVKCPFKELCYLADVSYVH